MLTIDALRDRLGAALFSRVGGPDGPRHRELIHGTPGPRWFATDDPVCVVHGDASMFIGGIRAIMLQSLHPAAMQGVADHSGYRGDMWGRLAQISTYLAVTTFGPEAMAEEAIAKVRRAHEWVTGTMPDGTPYAANDPHLLGWVHAAEVESFALAHRRFGHRPLSEPEYDDYVAQAARPARLLGVTAPPTSWRELLETLERYRPELRGTDAAREAIDWLVRHPDLPVAARPAYRVLVAAAVAQLPAWARAELALRPPSPVRDRAATAQGAAATRAIRWAMAPAHAETRRLAAAAEG